MDAGTGGSREHTWPRPLFRSYDRPCYIECLLAGGSSGNTHNTVNAAFRFRYLSIFIKIKKMLSKKFSNCQLFNKPKNILTKHTNKGKKMEKRKITDNDEEKENRVGI